MFLGALQLLTGIGTARSLYLDSTPTDELLPNAIPDPEARCRALKNTLRIENTTILGSDFLQPGDTVSTVGACGELGSWAETPLCRVQFAISTSREGSEVKGEAWLPETWYGRVLGVGNGGLGGCIPFIDLTYGSSMHFATVGSNAGHDGNFAAPFWNQPETTIDFGHRAVHVQTVVGKQIVRAYYGRPHTKSYWVGCSMGGRQGLQSAIKYPADFDGILAGAPATDFNRLLYWTGMMARAVGIPDADSPAAISAEEWVIISEEVMRQCDHLDGVRDGVITEPDDCVFDPSALSCSRRTTSRCLSRAQIDALKKIYSPVYVDGVYTFPRFDPGAETMSQGIPLLDSQTDFPLYPGDWLKFTVLNETEFDFTEYGPEQLRQMEFVNPGGVAAYDGDLSAFRDRGGKLITYHGRMDAQIPSGNSKRMYNHIAKTLGLTSNGMDSFYRLFLIPGMDHCTGGPPVSTSHFGQIGGSAPGSERNKSSHHIILAMVDWVEGGMPPETIIGTSEDYQRTRLHCRYPMKSVWEGPAWRCV
ncbi:unnamed protein product [Mycena citricolor]|uniref:Carboxylic ester hydrolase n=1 Tax=Mycena citricolor TaxID=2018698 RepID=A0AAD2GTF4_9AGAR|nr:unnamed protein product [Mycena citricolor]